MDTDMETPQETPAPLPPTEATVDTEKDAVSAGPVAPLTLLPAPASSLPVQKMPTIPQLAVALGVLGLVFALSYLPIRNREEKEAEHAREQPSKAAEQTADTQYFGNVAVSAGAAYVWDVKNQRALYNKNAGTQLPLASLTKLMTALVAYEHLDPTAEIRITPQALLEEGDSRLASGQAFTLQDLANLTLITSSNDGASVLAAAAGAALAPDENATGAFVAAMNARAEEIGLSQSYFTNPTGLDVNPTTSGSYGSARDMAFLMEYLVLHHPEILEGTKEAAATIRNQEGAVFRAINTNEITRSIPGLIGSKTGFTGLASGNLVIAYDAGLNRPIVITVLGSTREGRFSDIMTLIEETSRAIANE